jgi:hypothetical protein
VAAGIFACRKASASCAAAKTPNLTKALACFHVPEPCVCPIGRRDAGPLRQAECPTLRFQIEIIPEICPNTVVMKALGNSQLNRTLRSAGSPQRGPGGVRRPGGAPGLQNQRGAQQSPRWVRFPSASAICSISPNRPRSRPRPRKTGVMQRWSGGRQGNIEHRTSNTERRMQTLVRPGSSCDVRCLMFSVRYSQP